MKGCEVLPQKSTHFYPKLLDGLVFHRLGGRERRDGPGARSRSSITLISPDWILTTVTRRDRAAAADLVFRIFRRQHRRSSCRGSRSWAAGSAGRRRVRAVSYLSITSAGCVSVHVRVRSQVGALRCRRDGSGWAPRSARRRPRCRADAPGLARRTTGLARQRASRVRLHDATTDGQPGLEATTTSPIVRWRRTSGSASRPARRRPTSIPRKRRGWKVPTGPADRFAKIVRNYAMDYVRSALPELSAGFGPADARYLAA